MGKKADVIAAGALLWRERQGVLEVLAIHRPRYDDWSWPKGKADPGETIVETAAREVFEETGRYVTLGIPLPQVEYAASGGKHKVVHYWAARAQSKKNPARAALPDWKRAPRSEVDDTKWLTVAMARRRITREVDLGPLEALEEAWKTGRLQTRALVIARHAHARDRSSWNLSDLARPLKREGALRADRLTITFAAYGVTYLHSSPAARCVMTLQPYATATEKRIRLVEELTERTHDKKSHKTTAALTALMRKSSNGAVCVHRPTLGSLIDVLKAATDKHSTGTFPASNPYLPPGGLMVAHLVDGPDGPLVVASETHVD